MTQYQIAAVLADHRRWLRGEGGKRARLTGANLTGARLTGAVLRGAVLRGADLTGARLTGAVLRGASRGQMDTSLSFGIVRKAFLSRPVAIF